MVAPAIDISHIKKSFGKNHVLQDVSFKVDYGERVSLLGPGASGKSLLLKLLLGLENPDAGELSLGGINLGKVRSDAAQLALKDVGIAFQNTGLFDFMNVRDNLYFAIDHMRAYSEAKKVKKVEDLLHAVKLPGTLTMFPHELSGGMKRRVGIARALATDPLYAFFDEPTAGLDPVTSTIILQMIQGITSVDSPLNQKRVQLIATSNVEIAIRFADRIVLLWNGSIVADGYWRDLLLNASPEVKHFLSVRLIGLDEDYARSLLLPEEFMKEHWA